MNLRLIAVLLSSAGSINRHPPTTMYSYPHIYLQFNKNKVYIKHRLNVFFRFFIKKLKSKPVFYLSVDNSLITYGRFVTKHRQTPHTNGRKAITAIDPSKWPLTQKNILALRALTFFHSQLLPVTQGLPIISPPLITALM